MKTIIYISLIIILSGCELIVIGVRKPPIIHINQETAVGAIYVFKTELDNSNTRGALKIFARPGGGPILAIDKCDMYYEIDRIGRLIADKPITRISADTISGKMQAISVEFDYLKNFGFTAEKIDDNWFIVDYVER